jgi:F5/8 type C domain
VSAITGDDKPPAAVTNLSARGRTTTVHPATAIAASGQSSAAQAPPKVTDGNLASYWSSPGVGAPREEFITLDLGSVKSIGRVDLVARSQGYLFPVDLTVQTSVNNAAFNVVGRGTDLPVTQGMRHTFEFARVSARYVRISITETRRSAGGLYYAQIAEIQVVDPPAGRLLTLAWTETGDDGNVGTAKSYDVRYSRSPITTETQFSNATALVGEPVPQRAGAPASFSFEPPEEGVTLYFRMKAIDNSGNASPLSNQVSAAIAVLPP